jgi:hypothetical protein
MNHRAAYEDLPIVMPLYYMEPERTEAYEIRNEYYFGSELLVSPITEKMDRSARAAGVRTWIPEGVWADFFSGLVYQGGRTMELWRGIENMPVLMKAGAIVPMKNMALYDSSTENPKDMEVRIFPAAEGRFVLWEDADDTASDAEDQWAHTELSLKGNGKEKNRFMCFFVGAAQGNLAALPAKRSWKLVFVGVCDAPVRAEAGGLQMEVTSSYRREQAMLTVQIPETPVGEEICVSFPEGLALSDGDRIHRCVKLLERAQMKYDAKPEALQVIEKTGRKAVEPLGEMDLGKAVLGEISEILLA